MSRKAGGKKSDTASGTDSKTSGKDGASGESRQNRWRRIEALRERRALRDALEDVLGDEFDIDDTVFGISAADEQYFIKPSPAPEETSFDENSDDDDFDDDEDDIDDDFDDADDDSADDEVLDDDR